MATISKSVEIDVPVDRVFGFLTDPNNLLEIMPSMVEVSNVQKTGDGAHSFDWVYKMAGLRFRGHSDTPEAEKNRRVLVKNSGIPSTFEYLYENVGGKTRLSMNVDYTIPGQVLGKLAEPIVRRMNEHEAEAMLQNLKARMELAPMPNREAHVSR